MLSQYARTVECGSQYPFAVELLAAFLEKSTSPVRRSVTITVGEETAGSETAAAGSAHSSGKIIHRRKNNGRNFIFFMLFSLKVWYDVL